MSVPVTSPTANPATLGGTTANSTVSITPSGNTLFASLLSMGMSNFSMLSTESVQGQELAAPVANTDTKSLATITGSSSLSKELLISTGELSSMSQDDLESLLANLGDVTDELSPKILVALAPGVPAKEAFDNIKAKFAELGIDTSKFTSVTVTTPTEPSSPVLATETTDVTTNATIATTNASDGTLTVDTTDAAQAVNFLLITTGFAPSEMGDLKKSIQSLIKSTDTGLSTDDTELSTSDITDNSEDVNASAVMVMLFFVAPALKPVDTPTAQDMSFDISSLSAFTQTAGGDMDVAPDWTKKLSDKLSSMSLTDASSPFDTNASPFDDEMNAILSPATIAGSEAGFKGSLSTTSATPKESSNLTKDVSGEISTQATLAANQLATISAFSLQNAGGDGLLFANGNMISVQNMPSSMTNPLFTSASAIGTHPAVQAVAQMIEKKTSGSEKATQELTVLLDPPELGRMQIQLSMEKDGVMKVHLLTENQETLSLFQRDAHALKSALDSAGIQVDSSSLTFDLASGDQSFNQLMGGSQDNQSGSNQSRNNIVGISGGAIDANDMSTINTQMDFTPSAITGNVHYSFWA